MTPSKSSSPSGKTWHEFTKGDPLVKFPVYNGDSETEKFFVRVPCRGSHFKILLFGHYGQNSHIELWHKRSTGNIFCNEGGDKDWFGGKYTEFPIKSTPCGPGAIPEYLYFIIRIEKSSDSIKIIASSEDPDISDRIYYEATFDETDGACSQPTHEVSAQDLDYFGKILFFAG